MTRTIRSAYASRTSIRRGAVAEEEGQHGRSSQRQGQGSAQKETEGRETRGPAARTTAACLGCAEPRPQSMSLLLWMIVGAIAGWLAAHALQDTSYGQMPE